MSRVADITQIQKCVNKISSNEGLCTNIKNNELNHSVQGPAQVASLYSLHSDCASILSSVTHTHTHTHTHTDPRICALCPHTHSLTYVATPTGTHTHTCAHAHSPLGFLRLALMLAVHPLRVRPSLSILHFRTPFCFFMTQFKIISYVYKFLS